MECERFFIAWCKAVCKLLYIPARTHYNLLLSPILGCDNVEYHLHMRFTKFHHSTIHSKNKCICMCAKLAVYRSDSKACNSLNHAHRYWFDKFRVFEQMLIRPSLVEASELEILRAGANHTSPCYVPRVRIKCIVIYYYYRVKSLFPKSLRRWFING